LQSPPPRWCVFFSRLVTVLLSPLLSLSGLFLPVFRAEFSWCCFRCCWFFNTRAGFHLAPFPLRVSPLPKPTVSSLHGHATADPIRSLNSRGTVFLLPSLSWSTPTFEVSRGHPFLFHSCSWNRRQFSFSTTMFPPIAFLFMPATPGPFFLTCPFMGTENSP